MASKGYGIWVCNPVSFTQQSDAENPRSPHIHLNFTDSSSNQKQAAINVQSTDSDERLVYWFNKNWSHPITQSLSGLSLGFQNLTESSTLPGLDFWRTQPALFDFNSGVVLDTGDSVEAQVDQVLNNAIESEAKAYIFGVSYGTGIHDIHCNQGSKPTYDNWTYRDGGLVFEYADGHYESIFLAFASQKQPTDDETGLPTADSKTLAQLLGAPVVSGDSSENNDADHKKHHRNHHQQEQ